MTQATPRPTTAAPPPGQAAPPGQAGQPVITTGPGRSETPQQIRDRIRQDVQNAVNNGGNPQINFPDRLDFRDAVPEGAVIIAVALFVSIAATIIFAPLARAAARRMDAGTQGSLAQGSLVRGSDMAPRMAQLQDSVDAMAMELERISEAQRFQSKLLSERAKDPAAPR